MDNLYTLARDLYGLVHARYILTSAGQRAMVTTPER